MKKYSVIIVLALAFSCGNAEKSAPSHVVTTKSENTLFNKIPSDQSGLKFINSIKESKELNHLKWDALFYGGGVAIGDINNDGLSDIYLTGNQINDGLFLNKGNLQFEDISTESGIGSFPGWSNGVTMADINADGNLDIYVCKTSWKMDNDSPEERKNLAFINNGDNTFTEKSKDYGLDDHGFSTQATFFDFDGDTDLDMFLVNSPSNNLQQKVIYSKSQFPEFVSDKLFRNDGDHFTDVTRSSGVTSQSFGLGVIAQDLNHDGFTDLYVANDYEKPDLYYINNGDGTFNNKLDQNFKHIANTAMGVDAGDIDNDALLDLCVLDMQSESHLRSKTNMPSMSTSEFFKLVSNGYNYQYMSNVLQKNNGAGFFADVAQLAGVASTDWSWSALFSDFDNDEFQDLLVTNGINRDIRNNDFALEFEKKLNEGEKIDLFQLALSTPSTKIPNYLFKNSGDLTFKNVAKNWGLNDPSFSYGAAYADLDNDGDLDLVIHNNEDNVSLYENSGNSNNWLKIRFKGIGGNLDGLNSKAILYYKDKKQLKELTLTRGYQSSVAPELHFGLGAVELIDSVLCLFNDGTSVKYKNVKPNQVLTANQKNASKQAYKVYDIPKHIFQRVQQDLGLNFKHQENDFNDWENEILLPHRESRSGPDIVTGDLNKDGLMDVVLGAGAGQELMVLFQTANKSFRLISGPWTDNSKSENTSIELLDIDKNGTLDIYVVNGGNHYSKSDDYSHEIYLQNNQGGFVYQKGESLNGISSCSADINQDGFIDIFITGNNEFNNYPNSAGNLLLCNKKGVLTKTPEAFIDSLPEGIIKDACFTDLNSDGYPELCFLGHWMKPYVCWNDAGKLQLAQPLGPSSGWWNSITPADLDGDGKTDLICGNMGLNNKYHPSEKKPLKLYQSDFDNNQTNDIVMAKSFNNNFVPLRGRECSSEQMPFIKEKFDDYESFANATIEEVLGEKINEAEFFSVSDFASCILYNNGDGTFTQKKFENIAQTFPLMDVLVKDFNKNGKKDLLMIGNNFDAEVETTRHDSGNGLLLLQNSSKNYEVRSGLKSGFFAPGNAKCLKSIPYASGSLIMVGNNNSNLDLYFVK